MYIYQSIDGTGLNRAQWEALKDSDEWTVKQYKNGKICVRLHWVGRYKKDLPAEYRHSHGIQVWNKVAVRDDEWAAEGVTIDKGYILDPAASETFRTRSAAEAAYEDMLLNYTESEIHEADNGDIILVEKGNEFKPAMKDTTAMMFDEDLKAAAAEKGVDLGGWS